MSTPTKSKRWLLQNKPTDAVVLTGPSATFRLDEASLPTLSTNQLLVQTLYLSNDPAQRGWISPAISADRLYVPPVEVGDPMRARAIARVLESSSDTHAKGSLVLASTGWTDFSVLDAKDCQPLQEIPGVSPTHYLGALGLTGLTAYYGLVEVVRATAQDAVVVSGAAGATGSMVVQIAKKMVGCRKVVGVAGSDDKCRWVERLGADVCLNYKSSTFKEDLVGATDGFVDVYFDNVGGDVLDLMLGRMKRHGRIAACGAIASYNTSKPAGLSNYFEVISNRLEIRGFIVMDYLHKARETVEKLMVAVKEGKIQVGDENETVVPAAFEDIPKTWLKLFEGGNTGKLVTKLT